MDNSVLFVDATDVIYSLAARVNLDIFIYANI